MESTRNDKTSREDLDFLRHKVAGESPSPAPSHPVPAVSPSPAPSDLVSLEQKIPLWAKPRPLYLADSVHPTHSLRYDWTGWLPNGDPFPPTTPDAIRRTAPLWATDGLHLCEFRIIDNRAQILFTAQPDISPRLFCSRVKGRLQHALRTTGTPVTFSRKLSFRSVGENTSAAVAGYLAKQVRKERFADPRYAKKMEQYTVEHRNIDLSEPTASSSGRYWYNLHLVLVVAGRRRIIDHGLFAKLRDGSATLAEEKGCRLKSVSVMPNHLHAALSGNIEMSPEEIALACLNGLATAAGRFRVWRDHYYIGTFSEYGMDLIREFSQRS